MNTAISSSTHLGANTVDTGLRGDSLSTPAKSREILKNAAALFAGKTGKVRADYTTNAGENTTLSVGKPAKGIIHLWETSSRRAKTINYLKSLIDQGFSDDSNIPDDRREAVRAAREDIKAFLDQSRSRGITASELSSRLEALNRALRPSISFDNIEKNNVPGVKKLPGYEAGFRAFKQHNYISDDSPTEPSENDKNNYRIRGDLSTVRKKTSASRLGAGFNGEAFELEDSKGETTGEVLKLVNNPKNTPVSEALKFGETVPGRLQNNPESPLLRPTKYYVNVPSEDGNKTSALYSVNADQLMPFLRSIKDKFGPDKTVSVVGSIMPKGPGVSLECLTKEHLENSETKASQHFKEILRGMWKAYQELQGKRIVHGDFNYWNMNYDPDSKKLSIYDYGLSRQIPKSTKISHSSTDSRPTKSDSDGTRMKVTANTVASNFGLQDWVNSNSDPEMVALWQKIQNPQSLA